MAKTIYPTKQFKRDIKKHCLQLISPQWGEVFHCLLNDVPLPAKYVNPLLKGEWKGCMDCHIKPDLVLIYEIQGEDIIFHRMGSHSELSIA